MTAAATPTAAPPATKHNNNTNSINTDNNKNNNNKNNNNSNNNNNNNNSTQFIQSQGFSNTTNHPTNINSPSSINGGSLHHTNSSSLSAFSFSSASPPNHPHSPAGPPTTDKNEHIINSKDNNTSTNIMIDSPSLHHNQQNPPSINTKLEDQKRQFTDTFKDNLSPAKKRTSKSAANPPPRKRTTRACDQCNHLRTKCDGKNPCAHCIGIFCLDL
jgi:hypothetical protein